MLLTAFKYFIILWILVGIYKFLIVPYLNKKLKKKRERIQKLADSFGEALNESIEETRKLRSDELPSDEDILLYYKMFCKKWELDNKDTWTTLEPMSFDMWEHYVKEGNGRSKGWEFMIHMTSDAFTFSTEGSTCMRFNNYRKMVENDDREFLNNVEQAAEEMES